MTGPLQHPPYEQQPAEQRGIPLPTYQPWLVWLLLAANIVVYAFMLQSREPGERYDLLLLRFGGKYGPAIAAGEYWRLLTACMLHGGVVHLLLNSYALYSIGPETERIFGTPRFGAIYLVAGLAGSVLSYVLNPQVLSVGASGAIFGLMGALGAFYWRARDLLGEASTAQLRQIGWLAGINLLIGLSIPNIDNYGHIGGLVGGALAGLALTPRFEVLVIERQIELRRGVSGLPGWLVVGGLLGLLAAATLGATMLH